MNQERKPIVASEGVGALAQFIRTLRLVWRLLLDPRAAFPKLIVLGATLYLFSPIDLVPDMILGMGQVDDIAMLYLGLSLFIELCPRDVVDEHRRALARVRHPGRPQGENIVEGTYRVISDNDLPNDDLPNADPKNMP